MNVQGILARGKRMQELMNGATFLLFLLSCGLAQRKGKKKTCAPFPVFVSFYLWLSNKDIRI
jgi:hypothetical protein